MSDLPTLSIDDRVATIALRRPTKRNRIEPSDIAAIIEHCNTIDANPDVAVAVVSATGPSWCSGYHLGALAAGERAEYSFGDLCDRVETVAVPTIAALGGNIHGGGTDLAISCDFRIGAEGIVLAMPAAKIGLQYYASGLRRFVERIGPDATKRLFLTAETIPANELLRFGYCTELVAAEGLTDRVSELAATIRALAPNAVRDTKSAINAIASGNADLDAIQAGHLASVRADEHRDAMAALANRRR